MLIKIIIAALGIVALIDTFVIMCLGYAAGQEDRWMEEMQKNEEDEKDA